MQVRKLMSRREKWTICARRMQAVKRFVNKQASSVKRLHMAKGRSDEPTKRAQEVKIGGERLSELCKD